MKIFETLIFILLLFISNSFNSQVAIGKESLSSSSVSLEFYDFSDNRRGLVLPWVSTISNIPMIYNATTGEGYPGMQSVSNGTIIFDLPDYKIKAMINGFWKDFTIKDKNTSVNATDSSNNIVLISGSTSVDSSIQDKKKEQYSASVVIGNINNSEANVNGILILSDTNKAMILPKVVSPHLNIVNPSAGVIAFDTVSQQVCFFNGTIWSFWKP